MKIVRLIFLLFLIIPIFIFSKQTNIFKPNLYPIHIDQSFAKSAKDHEKKAKKDEKKAIEADYKEFSEFMKDVGCGSGSCQTICAEINKIAARYDMQIKCCNHSDNQSHKISYIHAAINLCKNKIGLLLRVLKALEGEHLDWQVKLKNSCKQELNIQKANVNFLSIELSKYEKPSNISSVRSQ